MNIGNIKIKNLASLAPMAGVTDRAFREICSIFSPAYFTSEMVSVKGIIYNSKKTFSLIEHGNCEKPFALQLFGSEPDDFYKAVNLISEYLPHIDIIDINMGCPATKIVKENSGSALMKTPKICGEIIKSVKKACNLPVTVKIRSGWDSINAPEVAKYCCEAGVDAITVHGRTKKQGYSGNVSLEVIKDVKKVSNVVVIGNGDITCAKDARKMIEYTNCDAVAIGRGAFGNPWIFREVNNCFSGENEFYKPTLKEKSEIMKLHVQKICEYKGEEVALKESRKHLAAYIREFEGAAEFRKKVFCSKNIDEILEICYNISK